MSKWTLQIAIHKGTLTSRDIEPTKEFDSQDAAMVDFQDAKKFYRSIGYQIWYAILTSPDNTKQTLEQNPYI